MTKLENMTNVHEDIIQTGIGKIFEKFLFGFGFSVRLYLFYRALNSKNESYLTLGGISI